MSFFTFAYGVYVVAVSAYIISENRRPQSAFAWLFLFNGLAYLLWSLGSGHLRLVVAGDDGRL